MNGTKALEQIRAGVVGEFTPLTESLLGRTYGGMVRLEEDGATATLIADDDLYDRKGLPLDAACIYGATQAGDVVVIAPNRRSSQHGNLATAAYASKYLLVDVTPMELDADKVLSVQHQYYGLAEWVQRGLYDEEPIVEGDEIVGWQSRLTYGTSMTAAISDGFTVRLSPAWAIGGEFDRRTIETPLAVTIDSGTRRALHDHALRMDAVHALLNVVHRDPVKAFAGSVRLSEESRTRCGYWDAELMSLDATRSPTNEFAHLGLESIGGVEGVASWVRLVLEHRRAVVPIVRHTLFSNQTPEARLLSTASAIEYWVAAHRRSADWARKVPGSTIVDALMAIVDPAWASWIGRPEAWSEELWKTYNELKHAPETDHEPSRVHALEVSGRWLLAAVLLDHCAGTTGPSARLFTNTLGVVGNSVRTRLGYDSD